MFDLKRLDVYRKIPKDLTQPSISGAVVSIISISFIIFLLLTEFFSFLVIDVKSDMLSVTQITIMRSVLGIDIQDDLGRHEVGFKQNIVKKEIDDGTGCNINGHFDVNKVPGNFHLSTHSASRQPVSINMAHIVHELSFGEIIDDDKITGAFNPLKGIQKLEASDQTSHDYFIKVVPTRHKPLWGVERFSYQYTYAYKGYASSSHGRRVIPAVWFRYDLSPITIMYTENRQPFYHFITTICAIIGGTFTVSGIINSLVFTASEVFKKFEMGKLG